jgi:hypothetical protein
VPDFFRERLGALVDHAVEFAARVASSPANETRSRLAADALYHAASAALLAWESARSGNGKRLLAARMVVDHRLSPQDPMALGDDRGEREAISLLLQEERVPLAEAARLV